MGHPFIIVKSIYNITSAVHFSAFLHFSTCTWNSLTKTFNKNVQNISLGVVPKADSFFVKPFDGSV